MLIADLDLNKTVHLAGIAGSAMRGLAVLLRERGFQVSGTDPNIADVKERLERAGVTVYREQDGTHIPKSAGLVVASAALHGEHPELRAARARGIAVVTYAEFLGALMGESQGVAVAGTHGKTTTTGMIIQVLKTSGIDPGYVVGGEVGGLGESAGAGTSSIFVAEACEYNRSFLFLKPVIAVINNIEEDHLDIYRDLAEIQSAFRQFAEGLPSAGRLVYSADCANTREILDGLECETTSFGVERPADYVASELRVHPGGTDFKVVKQGKAIQSMTVVVPGRHNVANGMAAALVCRRLGISWEQIAEGLRRFQGVRRRFERRGEQGGIAVYDDYAHHPTEIRALLSAARERFPTRRVIAVFQPHQLSRTRLLLRDFAKAFEKADRVIISDIYSVRDSAEEKQKVCTGDLVAAIAAQGVHVEHGGDLTSTRRLVLETVEPGDLVLTIGAGNIDSIVEPLLSSFS